MADLILVTGSAGRIGQAVVRELVARGRAVRGLDIVPTPGATESVVGDIASFDAVRGAMTGVTALVHLAATPDGRLLVATQKGPGTVTIWRLADDSLLAEISGTRKVASGVAVSRDSRYAFVTLEGIGGDPGTIDIIDLKSRRTVASVEIGRQAGGIALLP